MEKSFNINGVCYPDENYMIDISGRLKEIEGLVDSHKYFVINRARQYGKTTTIRLLSKKLSEHYIVFSISFEGIGEIAYEGEYAFCRRVCGLLYDTIFYGEVNHIPDSIREMCRSMSQDDTVKTDFRDLSNFISRLCAEVERPVVLIIDEVDQAGDQEIFLGFLGMLRDKYLKRKDRPTFQSVILAGVYDIKNLKSRIRKEAEHQYNSPWNIAARFDVDMSFSPADIAGMLAAYEQDKETGMDIKKISRAIYDYTSGYPFLVSGICKIMDEQFPKSGNFESPAVIWTEWGVAEAVKELLRESNTLFDDMCKKIADFPELHAMLYAILFQGKSFPYNTDNYAINIGSMFGFIKEQQGMVAVSNRIFETRLYNLFLSEEILNSAISQIRLSV